jgi:hypothetical protein
MSVHLTGSKRIVCRARPAHKIPAATALQQLRSPFLTESMVGGSSAICPAPVPDDGCIVPGTLLSSYTSSAVVATSGTIQLSSISPLSYPLCGGQTFSFIPFESKSKDKAFRACPKGGKFSGELQFPPKFKKAVFLYADTAS